MPYLLKNKISPLKWYEKAVEFKFKFPSKKFRRDFCLNQSINRGQILVYPFSVPESIEWYTITLSFSDSDHLANKTWNKLLQRLDTSMVDWQEFYIQCNQGLLDGFSIDFPPFQSVGPEQYIQWSYSKEVLFLVDTNELHALYTSIDKLQVLAVQRFTGSIDDACKYLAKMPASNFDNSGGSNDVSFCRETIRFKLAWCQFTLFVELVHAPHSEALKLYHFKLIYTWFMRQSESLYNVIHPSRKYKWRSQLEALPMELEENENKRVLEVKWFLRHHYILKILKGTFMPADALWDTLSRTLFKFKSAATDKVFPRYMKILIDAILDDLEGFKSGIKYEEEIGFLISQPESFPYCRQLLVNGKKIGFLHERLPLYDIEKSRIQGEFRNIHEGSRGIRKASPDTLKKIFMGLEILLSQCLKYQLTQNLNRHFPRKLCIPSPDFIFLLSSIRFGESPLILQYTYFRRQEERNIFLIIEEYYFETINVLERITTYNYEYGLISTN